jgi:hypothetical protein
MFQINWKLKAILYKLFSLLKLKKTFYFIQKHVTKRSRINITEINKLWVFHSDAIEDSKSKKILEVGAGKSLEQNIYLSYKFGSIINQTAIDINNMLDFKLFNDASAQIANLLKLKNKGDIKNISDLKTRYNITYIAPFKISELNIEEKFDICISTTALEHFSILDLQNYLLDLKKVLNDNGLISSLIDYSDHYSHTDKNINTLNFLSYSKKEWEKYNNSYLYQNRLRHQDYKKLFIDQGYKIVKIIKGNVTSPNKKISNEFDITNDETFLNWAYFLTKKN